jgi:TolB-like protein
MVLSLVLGFAMAGTEPPTLAVLYFDNNSKDESLEVLRKGLADMIVTDLVAWDGVTVVERDRLESIIAELKLQRTKYFDRSQALQIGKFLKAKYLLMGSLQIIKERLILDARIVDARSGAAIVSARADGPQDDVFSVEQSLVERITVGIDLKLKNEAQRRKAKVPSLDDLLAYSKALDLSDQGRADEAEKAFSALVTKRPTFLMARERKAQAAQALAEYAKRKADLVTESILKLGRAADEALREESKFEAMTEPDQLRFLSFRVVKNRVLARVLKQHLSTHHSSLRVPLQARKQDFLIGLQSIVANLQLSAEETRRFVRARTTVVNGIEIRPQLTFAVPDELKNAFSDARFGGQRLPDEQELFEAVLDAVFLGRLKDGDDSYTVAPTLADLAPEQASAVWKKLERNEEAALSAPLTAPPSQKSLLQATAIRWLMKKAELLDALRKDDEAVSAYQRILDAFPTDPGNTFRETRIRQLIGAQNDSTRVAPERWAKALRGCDDMDLRVGSQVAVEFVRHAGIEGLDRFAAELEKACAPSAKTISALAYIYGGLARDAASFDDCERSTRFWRKYLEVGGSVSDMHGYHQNYVPWCTYGPLVSTVTWMRFSVGQGGVGEVDQGLMSIRSRDGTQLSISGRNESGSTQLSLLLAPQTKGWACREATWRSNGQLLTGSCTVTLRKEAQDIGQMDEGTFTARFGADAGGVIELSGGDFRIRRQ